MLQNREPTTSEILGTLLKFSSVDPKLSLKAKRFFFFSHVQGTVYFNSDFMYIRDFQC